VSYYIEETELLSMLRAAYEEGRCGFYDLKEDAVVGILMGFNNKKLRAAGIPLGVDPAAYMRSQLIDGNRGAFDVNSVPILATGVNVAGSIGFQVPNPVNSITGTTEFQLGSGRIQFDQQALVVSSGNSFSFPNNENLTFDGSSIMANTSGNLSLGDRTISFVDNNTDSGL
jgi:hypothetical protein